MNIDIEARHLQSGDVVIGPFNKRTVDHVRVHAATIADEDPTNHHPGAFVTYVNGPTVRYRVDALLTVER